MSLAISWLVACTQPVTLPAPTGDFGIGETTIRLVSRDRDETMTVADGDARELTVHLFYPAAPPVDAEAADYVPDLRELKPALDHQTQRLFRLVQGHAVLDAPVAATPAMFPVIVFSHGDDRIGAEYGFLVEDLVSRGYAVAAIDHPYDARAALLADGSAVAYLAEAWPPLPPPPADGLPDPDSAHALFYRERVGVRSADASFVLDTLTTQDPTAGLGDGTPRLALDRVAFIGHSVGGVAAGQFCQDDPRAAGCVNLDGESGFGPFYLEDDGTSFDPPFMMLTKTFEVSDTQLADWGLTRESWAELLAAQRDAYFGSVGSGSFRVELDGATHESFGDEPFVLSSLERTGDVGVHEDRMKIIRGYVAAFVDRFVGGLPTTLLDEEPEPGVLIERWPAQ